uniref:RING-H2 finger protein ATL5 n=1 Tax=Anthurium amnicola TaxID=1678845 RepID=A0A1D1XED7_9ARAE
MDLGEADTASGECAGGGGALASQARVPCSICLEGVEDDGERSTAKLLCGHRFHLDCIGSAFNAKGVMQCPNCRKIEKGDWLYANGCHSFRETSLDGWTYDEDMYDPNYSEMSYEFHWCPFTRLAHVPSSIEDGESQSISYNGLDGHHSVFTVPPATWLAHPCPYLPYLHPVRPSSSSQVSTDSGTDGPTVHHHWSNRYGPIEIQTSHAFPATDIHYHSQEPHPPAHSHLSSRVSGADQFSVPSATVRSTRHDLDGHPRRATFLHPFIIRHGLASRASTSSDSVPLYVGTSQAEVHPQDLHGTYQHYSAVSMGAPFVPGTRRSSGMSLTSRAPTPSDHYGSYLLPSAPSSGQSPQDGQAARVDHFYAWERDQLTPFPLTPVERDSAWWGPFHQIPVSSDTGGVTGSWHQHNSESSSSQGRSEGFSDLPIRPPQMYPFI